MQLSFLTVYCMYVLSNIFRCGSLQENLNLLNLKLKNENGVEKCIVTRICFVADFGTSAECTEEIFTSRNVSVITFHLITKGCFPIGELSPSIGWFVNKPLQQWIDKCWNKKKCRVNIGKISRQVNVGALIGTVEGHGVVSPSACFIRTIAGKGKIGVPSENGSTLNCKDATLLQDSADIERNDRRIQWILPAKLYSRFRRHLTRQIRHNRSPRDNGRYREKRHGNNIPGEIFPKSFTNPQTDVLDNLFDDNFDSGDSFTGLLTPEEKAWTGDLPDSLNTVMTFPDDYMHRISGEARHKNRIGKKRKKIILPLEDKSAFFVPSEIFPETMASGPNLFSRTGAFQKKDMQTSLEEDIQDKLQSSLEDLMQHKDNEKKEEMSLVESLALENKVTNALASMEKEPDLGQLPIESNNLLTLYDKEKQTVRTVNKSSKNKSPGPIFANSIPFSPISSDRVNVLRHETTQKPSHPSSKLVVIKPPSPKQSLQSNVSQQHENTSNTLDIPLRTNESSPDFLELPFLTDDQIVANATDTSSMDRSIKNSILQAEQILQISFNRLRQELEHHLNTRTYPRRLKMLRSLESDIQMTTYATVWAVVKQVCSEPLERMKLMTSNWLTWSAWSPCTATCGFSGYHIRRRRCQPLHICSGSAFDLKPCKHQVDCNDFAVWQDWSSWSHCSISCGQEGYKLRIRTCLTDDLNDRCKGDGAEFSLCAALLPCVHQNLTQPNRTAVLENATNLVSTINTTLLPSSGINPKEKHRWRRKKYKKHRKKMKYQNKRRNQKSKRFRNQPEMKRQQSLGHDDLKYFQDMDIADDGMVELQDFRSQQEDKPEIKPVSEDENIVSPDSVQSDINPEQDVDASKEINTIIWTAWGLWSTCSVSCGKGTQVRKRICMKLVGNTFVGKPEKADLCSGSDKNKKYCGQDPCILSAPIPQNLFGIEEGGNATIRCRHAYDGNATDVYWITPDGEHVTSNTLSDKYMVENYSLIIHHAHKADLGQYFCVPVGAIQRVDVYFQELKSSEVQHLDSCGHSPCENGGTCVPMTSTWSAELILYTCHCPKGYFGKHCEQKSLVHQLLPDLEVMGAVLIGFIALLCLVCSGMFIYYRIQSKLNRVSSMPVMTRRRSEDQWRKMKRFDQKGYQHKKKSISRDIKRRLSHFIRADIAEKITDKQPLVRFGVEEQNSPDSAKTANVTFGPEKQSDKDSPNADLQQTSRPLEDTSHNASPPPTNRSNGQGQSDSYIRQMDSPPILETNSGILYSDDMMDVYTCNESGHLKRVEERMQRETYSSSLDRSDGSISSPEAYIFRSKHSSDHNVSHHQMPSSRPDQQFRRKRFAQENCARSRSREFEFNQNNSDASSEGSCEREKQRNADQIVSSPDVSSQPGVSGAGMKRGQVESVQQNSSGQGARPKLRSCSKNKLRDFSSTSTAAAKVSEEPRIDNVSQRNQDFQRYTLAGSTYFEDQNEFAETSSFKAYEVHHPDEPYPFRLSRTRRRLRDSPEESSLCRTASAERQHRGSEENCENTLTEQSAGAVSQENDLPPQPRYLAGGGEGTASTSRQDSRKSDRDVLFRRAVENSYIQATAGHDVGRSRFPGVVHSVADTRRQLAAEIDSGVVSVGSVMESARHLPSLLSSTNWPKGSGYKERENLEESARQRFTFHSDQDSSSAFHFSPVVPPMPRKTRLKCRLDSEKECERTLFSNDDDDDERAEESSAGSMCTILHAEMGKGLKQADNLTLCSQPKQPQDKKPSLKDKKKAFYKPRHQASSFLQASSSSEKKENDSGYQETLEHNQSGRSRPLHREMLQTPEKGIQGTNQSLFYCSPSAPSKQLGEENLTTNCENRYNSDKMVAECRSWRTSSECPCTSRGNQALRSVMKQRSGPCKDDSFRGNKSSHRVTFQEPKLNRNSCVLDCMEDENARMNDFASVSQRVDEPMGMDGQIDHISMSFSTLPNAATSADSQFGRNDFCADNLGDRRKVSIPRTRQGELGQNYTLAGKITPVEWPLEMKHRIDETYSVNIEASTQRGQKKPWVLSQCFGKPCPASLPGILVSAELSESNSADEGHSSTWSGVQPLLPVNPGIHDSASNESCSELNVLMQKEACASVSVHRQGLPFSSTGPGSSHPDSVQSTPKTSSLVTDAVTQNAQMSQLQSSLAGQHSVSMDLFQELLVTRAPNAFFKPILEEGKSRKSPS